MSDDTNYDCIKQELTLREYEDGYQFGVTGAIITNYSPFTPAFLLGYEDGITDYEIEHNA